MGDLTIERIAALKHSLTMRQEVEDDELLALLSMAERSVSIETVRKLADWLSARPGNPKWSHDAHQAWMAGAHADLRAAAEALASEESR